MSEGCLDIFEQVCQGRKSAKRSNGLDTVRYKNILLLQVTVMQVRGLRRAHRHTASKYHE